MAKILALFTIRMKIEFPDSKIHIESIENLMILNMKETRMSKIKYTLLLMKYNLLKKVEREFNEYYT